MRRWIIGLLLLLVPSAASAQFAPVAVSSTQLPAALGTGGGLKTLLVDTGGNAITLASDAVTGEPSIGSGPEVYAVFRPTLSALGDTAEDNVPLLVDSMGLLWTRNGGPCSSAATKLYLPIDVTTATTTELTPSLSGSATYYHVCALNLVTTAANQISLVDDDTDGCGSATAALVGGLTGAEGWNFAANGGLTLGNGAGSVMRAVTANSVLCLVTAQATQVAGQIVVVAAP